MGSNLYISRELLSILGVNDFGIYNVVYGSVIILTVLTGSLSAAVTRFMNYEIANKKRVNIIFVNSLCMHFIFSLIIVMSIFILGNGIIKNGLNISEFRFDAALMALYSASISFAITLISVSFTALIIANEDIKIFTVIGFIEIVFKLASIVVLKLIDCDKLVLYSMLVALNSTIVLVIYIITCKKKYRFIRYKAEYDPVLLKEMFSFIGWNSIGSGSVVLKDQGVNILINIFFGATINTARAIAFQVSSAINSVISQLLFAVNPRITKLISDKKYDESIELAVNVSRYSYFFMLLMCLTVYFNLDDLLTIWLVDVPKYTMVFLSLILINLLIDVLSGPLITLMLATGNIRNYQIVVGLVNALNFPISYIFLNYGFDFKITIYISIVISLANFTLRFVMLNRIIKIDCSMYINKVLVRVFLVSISSYSLLHISWMYIPRYIFENLLFNLLTHISISVLQIVFIIYSLGLESVEKEYIKKHLNHLRGK